MISYGSGGGSGYRRQKKERRKTKRDFPDQRFLRVTAELKLQSDGEIIKGRVLLNDLTPAGVGLFVNRSVDKGEEISMVIEHPKHLFLKGIVVWCALCPLDTKIISEDRFRYRIGVRLSFDSAEEREAVRKYCDEIAVRLDRTG